MNGVTILNTTEIYDPAWWQLLLGLSPLIISAVIYSTRLYIAFKKGTDDEQRRGVVSAEHWNPKELLTLLIGGIVSISLTICLDIFLPAAYLETHYEIKVEDSASFNEVYDVYTIIEERDNTFIVKERINNE